MGLFLSICKCAHKPVDMDGEALDLTVDFGPIGDSEKGILLLETNGTSRETPKKTQKKNKETFY
ncbi:ORF38 [Retroperitoneal fibromatosis-associated herpesvirus]|uniref:Cytoplasmic envelopment protein 3 n=1 Tax=Retroperitoneal fibromatosis-associated herpesvirus TaxID=111469 RepID=U5NIE2_9GAMA|nr:ORF38 [Retroperitoneal fibromatosis-associated herpesvirus]AGY30720.1 ORF38 [Retroperitoneal fibromatosis-associated herpesvirus]